MLDNIWLSDKHGNKIKSFYQLDEELPKSMESGKDLKHTYQFEDAYIEVDKIGKVKIKEVQYLYDVNIGNAHKIKIDGEATAKAILKDVVTGKILFFEKDGTIK
jgi:hypothetical protein